MKIPKLNEIEQGPREAIVARLREGKGEVLPIISDSMFRSLIYGGDIDVVGDWAEHIEYPWPERIRLHAPGQVEGPLPGERDIAEICQYLQVMKKADPNVKANDRYVKEVYLRFLRLLLEAKAGKDAPDLLRRLQEDTELERLALTQRLARLYPGFNDDVQNPLPYLADLHLPIYLTTSYHKLLELALKSPTVNPRTEICYWNEELRRIPSVFAGKDYTPTANEPLVLHLFGVEDYDDSLVLTEDDHLNWLVAISRDRTAIPFPVHESLAISSLLLIGYSLRNWDFRVLFQGIVKPTDKGLRPKSIAVQVEEDQAEQPYLQNYLDQAKFEVVVGHANEFLADLWQRFKPSDKEQDGGIVG